MPVEHEDRSQKSDEEAERLNAVYRELLGQRWVNQRGETRRSPQTDILVVSPYNMQVNLLKQVLPNGARVGTVDKFQGQEGAVVLISMAASSGEHIPRGVEFSVLAKSAERGYFPRSLRVDRSGVAAAVGRHVPVGSADAAGQRRLLVWVVRLSSSGSRWLGHNSSGRRRRSTSKRKAAAYALRATAIVSRGQPADELPG